MNGVTEVKHLRPESQAEQNQIVYLKHLMIIEVIPEHELEARPVQQTCYVCHLQEHSSIVAIH